MFQMYTQLITDIFFTSIYWKSNVTKTFYALNERCQVGRENSTENDALQKDSRSNERQCEQRVQGISIQVSKRVWGKKRGTIS